MSDDIPVCPYCGRPAALVMGEAVYPHRPDLYPLMFWNCAPCDAYVGCHRPGQDMGDGTRPLGTLASRGLRELRNRTHMAFDPLWREGPNGSHGPMDRHAAYRWLAARLGLAVEACHVGGFDEKMCRRAIEISNLKRKDLGIL